jgi:hypothetical protein
MFRDIALDFLLHIMDNILEIFFDVYVLVLGEGILKTFVI